MEGQLSEKADVYSYGLLILNVVSGRMCIDPSQSPEERNIKAWVSSSRAFFICDTLLLF
jgi:hypothetical protein